MEKKMVRLALIGAVAMLVALAVTGLHATASACDTECPDHHVQGTRGHCDQNGQTISCVYTHMNPDYSRHSYIVECPIYGLGEKGNGGK